MPRSQFHFVPLRNLWVSLLGNDVNDRFPAASNPEPKRLVGQHTFKTAFWDNPQRLKRSQKGDLDLETAWFGIRSLLKGGKIGLEKDEFTPSDFKQLDKDKGSIDSTLTREFFSDVDLKTLLNIHEIYERWKNDLGYYDDLDIVKHAHKVYDATSASIESSPIKRLTKTEMDNAIIHLDLSIERFMFLQEAIQNYESQAEASQQREYTIKWIQKWHDRFELGKKITLPPYRGADRLGSSYKNGKKVPVYKERLSKDWRVIFSLIQEPTTPPYILVYDLVFDHDQQDSKIQKALFLNVDDAIENDDDVIIGDVDSIDDTAGQGPPKPLSGLDTSREISEVDIKKAMNDLDAKGNIVLDENQKRAVISNRPLLIDGLAGTGKTAALGKRAAYSAGFKKTKSTILITCANPSVVRRLHEDVSRCVHYEKVRQHFAEHTRKADFISVQVSGDESVIATRTNHFAPHIPDTGYDEIIIDECQDLTFLEFELLRKLSHGHNAHRLTMGGDPLQTLNPTGFDWKRIRAMFIDNGVSHADSEPTKFHSNYRSIRDVVDLANAIQSHRSTVTGEEAIEMIPKRERDTKPRIYSINSDEDREAVKRALSVSGQSPVNFICWAVDDQAVTDLLSPGGPNSDDLLSEVYSETEEGIALEDTSFRTRFYIHSSTSVKGMEFNSIALYRFASSKDFLDSLSSLKVPFGDVKRQTKKDDEAYRELIKIKFAFSRLYVAVTRAFKNVYFIENPEGAEFWKQIIFDPNFSVAREGQYLDFEFMNNTHEQMRRPDFVESEVATSQKFWYHATKWDEDKSIVDLELAIMVGGVLATKDSKVKLKLEQLLGDHCLEKSRRLGIDEKQRLRDRDRAIAHYEAAHLFEKCTPIYFEKKEYATCLELMQKSGSSKHPALGCVEWYCKFKLKKLTNVSFDSVDLITDVKKSEHPETPPPPLAWSFVDFDTLHQELKDFIRSILEDQGDAKILIKNERFFTWPKVRESLVKMDAHDELITYYELAENSSKLDSESNVKVYMNSLVATANRFDAEVITGDYPVKLAKISDTHSEFKKPVQDVITNAHCEIISTMEKTANIPQIHHTPYLTRRLSILESKPKLKILYHLGNLALAREEIDNHSVRERYGARIAMIADAVLLYHQAADKSNPKESMRCIMLAVSVVTKEDLPDSLQIFNDDKKLLKIAEELSQCPSIELLDSDWIEWLHTLEENGTISRRRLIEIARQDNCPEPAFHRIYAFYRPIWIEERNKYTPVHWILLRGLRLYGNKADLLEFEANIILLEDDLKNEFELVKFEIENSKAIKKILENSKKLKKGPLVNLAQQYASLLDRSGREEEASELRARLPEDIGREVDSAIKLGQINEILKAIEGIAIRDPSIRREDLIIRILKEANPPSKIQLYRDGHQLWTAVCDSSESSYKLATRAVANHPNCCLNLLNLAPTTIGLFALKEGRGSISLFEEKKDLLRDVFATSIDLKRGIAQRAMATRMEDANEIIPLTHRIQGLAWGEDIHVFVELLMIIELWRSTLPKLTEYCSLFDKVAKTPPKSDIISRLLKHLEIDAESEFQSMANKISEKFPDVPR